MFNGALTCLKADVNADITKWFHRIGRTLDVWLNQLTHTGV